MFHALLLAALAAAPTPEALRARATDAYRAGRLDEACPLFEQVTQARPDDGAAWADLGLCLIKQGKRDAGVEATCRALASSDAQARKSAAYNLDRLGARCPTAAPADLQSQRIEAARKTFEAERGRYDAGVSVLEPVYQWSLRWLDAERAAHPERAAEAHKAHLERMTALQARVHQRVQQGTSASVDASAADYYVLEARIWAQ